MYNKGRSNAAKVDETVGTGYKRKSKDGSSTYLAISLDLSKIKQTDGIVKLLAFPNKFKKEDKHPDFRILPVTQQAAGNTKTAAPVRAAAAVNTDDETPF